MITPNDLMESQEVAVALGVTTSSLMNAMSLPDKYPLLAARIPTPLRKIGRSWVWTRADVEASLASEQEEEAS